MAKGKEILSPIIFQGGVAANQGIRRAFEEQLKEEVLVPPNYDVSTIDCNDCSNSCEILEIKEDDKILSRYGDKCGKWSF